MYLKQHKKFLMSDAPQVVFNVLTNNGSYPSLKMAGFSYSEDGTLLDRYFELRAKVYAADGMDYYTDPVTPYDR